MKIFGKAPWYAAGLAFECTGCGRCCAGPGEGYVWVNDEEITAIAQSVGLAEPAFRKQYVRRVGSRLSLMERPDNHDCIFLVPRPEGGKKCSIYSVRPRQCSTWPFWPANVRQPQDWLLAGVRCEGINRGPLHNFDEIETKRKGSTY